MPGTFLAQFMAPFSNSLRKCCSDFKIFKRADYAFFALSFTLSLRHSMTRNPEPYNSLTTSWWIPAITPMIRFVSSRVKTTGILIFLAARSALIFSFSGCLHVCREKPAHSALDSVSRVPHSYREPWTSDTFRSSSLLQSGHRVTSC